MIVALNKPWGVLSQFTPEPGSQHTTLEQFGLPDGVYPVGRLDADSEGLLLLTDEKELVSRLLEPRNGHNRTYWVQVEGIPTIDALCELSAGVRLNGYTTQPCRVRLLHPEPTIWERTPPIRHRATIPTAWLEMILIEGKNRQVRRMTAKIGHPTLRLVRVRSGGLGLDTLELGSGAWCVLGADHRTLLLESRQSTSYR
jgi:23S rRNA pseudouridine2457 synthase